MILTTSFRVFIKKKNAYQISGAAEGFFLGSHGRTLVCCLGLGFAERGTKSLQKHSWVDIRNLGIPDTYCTLPETNSKHSENKPFGPKRKG